MRRHCLLSYLCIFIIILDFTKPCIGFFHQWSFSSSLRESNCGVLYAKKKLPPGKLPPNVAQYIRMRDLKRAQQQGASYDELKSLSINGTSAQGTSGRSTGENRSYQNIMKKGGNLDARLRSVIAYKRETIAVNEANTEGSGLTVEEEVELQRMMDSEEGDESMPGDEEEAEYEAAVLKAIEQNKLKEVKRNILMEQAVMEAKLEKMEKMQQLAQQESDDGTRSVNSSSSNSTKSSGSSSLPDVAEEDMYKPKVSTWGVFKRPKDISKAYGGGRAITREEMDRLDAEMEERERQTKLEQKQFLTASMKKEKEMEGSIKDALAKARGFMYAGNRQAAVDQLEPMMDVVSWTSDLGGEVLLELGMALETVDRSDEARKIYGKLASVSWSQKTRKSAVQLISGLDITNQIRKHVSPARSPMDEESRKKIGRALEVGLRNPWNDYKRKGTRNQRLDGYSPWLDDEVGMGREKFYASVTINSLRDAYGILQRELNPLKEVPGRLLASACRKFLMANKQDLIDFYALKVSMQQKIAQYQIPNYAPAVSLASGSSAGNGGTSGNGADGTPVVVLDELLTKVVNGTWDIVASVVDNSDYRTRRFELGSLRRTLDVVQSRCSESFPTMWGLSTATQRAAMTWDSYSQEVTLTGSDLKKSPAPWQKNAASEQTFQVTYCDDTIMVTRQVNEDVGKPDIYVLWKRVRANKYIKY